MKIKVSELTGAALDYAVALCEGFVPGTYMRSIAVLKDVHGKVSMLQVPISREYVTWEPTRSVQGDNIIDREHISVSWNGQQWLAAAISNDPDLECLRYGHRQWGDTRRIVAMRCYVAGKLGLEVDIPQELL